MSRHGCFISQVALAAMLAATVSASNAWAQSVTTEKQTVTSPAPATVQTTTPVAVPVAPAQPVTPVAQAVPVQSEGPASFKPTFTWFETRWRFASFVPVAPR